MNQQKRILKAIIELPEGICLEAGASVGHFL